MRFPAAQKRLGLAMTCRGLLEASGATCVVQREKLKAYIHIIYNTLLMSIPTLLLLHTQYNYIHNHVNVYAHFVKGMNRSTWTVESKLACA